jgi:hypothetical protein
MYTVQERRSGLSYKYDTAINYQYKFIIYYTHFIRCLSISIRVYESFFNKVGPRNEHIKEVLSTNSKTSIAKFNEEFI